MKEQKERLVSEGNAFYEIDLECIRRKEKEKGEQQEQKEQKTKGGG